MKTRQINLNGKNVLVDDPIAGMVNGEWGFKGADTTRYTHGIHKYPARMVPQIAKKLLLELSNNKSLIWDPFCGSGTVLLESMIAGRKAIGTDLNPLACLIARVKTTPIPKKDLRYWIEILMKQLRKNEKNKTELRRELNLDNFTLKIETWFNNKIITDLNVIRTAIEDLQPKAPKKMIDVFKVAFSRTIRKSSHQRQNEFKRYRIPEEQRKKNNPDSISFFINDIEIIAQMIDKLSKNFAKAPKPKVLLKDCSVYKSNKPIDLIITSPPYGDSMTTVAYGQFSSLMMEWLNLRGKDWRYVDDESVGGRKKSITDIPNSKTLKKVLMDIKIVDVNRAQVIKKFFSGMNICIKNFYKNLKRGGYMCIVIGNRTARGVTVPNAKIITEDALNKSFKHIETISRRIFFKVGPYKINPIGRTGKKQDTKAIGKEEIIILQKT